MDLSPFLSSRGTRDLRKKLLNQNPQSLCRDVTNISFLRNLVVWTRNIFNGLKSVATNISFLRNFYNKYEKSLRLDSLCSEGF